MTCHSCSMNIETFDNFPWLPQGTQSQKVEKFATDAPSKSSCKEMMTDCLYTAQGMFICEKQGAKPIVPNDEMAMLPMNGPRKTFASTASPWITKQ